MYWYDNLPSVARMHLPGTTIRNKGQKVKYVRPEFEQKEKKLRTPWKGYAQYLEQCKRAEERNT